RGGRAVSRAVEARREELARLFDRRILRDVAGAVSGRQQLLDEASLHLVRSTVARTHGVTAGELRPGLQHWYAPRLARLTVALQRALDQRIHRTGQLESDLTRSGTATLALLSQRARAMALRLKGLDPRA